MTELLNRHSIVRRTVRALALWFIVSATMTGDTALLAAVQAPGGASGALAQRLKDYRVLLGDKDSNVRLATLDEMLTSDVPSVRELAFDAAFGSDDSAMRALALRTRVLTMRVFSLEPHNPKNLSEQDWTTLLGSVGMPSQFEIAAIDPKTGNFELKGGWLGRVSGQEFSFSTRTGYSARLRLSDGGVMVGTFSYANRAVLPVRLPLQ